MKMNFSTDNLRRVFEPEGKYDSFRKLCFDLVHGNTIYDFDENGVRCEFSKKDANKAIRRVFMDICGLDEDSVKSNKLRKRALKKHGAELYEVMEEDIDFKVDQGYRESEWFNDFVDYRNEKLGDMTEFYSDYKMMFIVAEISGDHHDLTMQHLGEGSTYTVHTKKYGIRIGKDIDLILLGRVDYTTLINKISEAFIEDVQAKTYAAVYGAVEQLPNQSRFNKTGVLSETTKSAFDELVSDVAAANNAEVVIMGTKLALKKINVLADVDWRSDGQKEAVANSGRLGTYDGTELIEIPQRFAYNDMNTKLFSDNMLLIVPKGEDRFVKFIDKGDTEILEEGENKGDLADDFRTYEVQREYGVGVTVGNYFGRWVTE